MIKKSLLLLTRIVMIFGIITTINAQDDSSYAMWETVSITPDYTQLKVLGENMKKHNKKYHQDGPYKASVYNIVTGPNIGKMVWQMGPLNYSHLDSRPSEGGHDEDWRDNILPYVKKMTNGEYWKQDNDLSNVDMLDPETVTYPILYIRYFEAQRDHGYSIDHLLKQMSDAVKAMDGENPWGVYDNQFRQGYTIGRHLAWVSFNKNWAEFDKPPTFKKAFLKVHGEDSWTAFQDGMADSFSNSWDEVWEYNAELSGN